MNSMVDKKAAKREKMMNMPSYRLMVGTAKYMDKWFFWILSLVSSFLSVSVML